MSKLKCTVPLRRTIWFLTREGLIHENIFDKFSTCTLVVHFILSMSTLILMASSMVKVFIIRDTIVLNQIMCAFVSALTVIAKIFTTVKNKYFLRSIFDDLKSFAFNSHNEKHNEHVKVMHKITNLLFNYYVVVGVLFVLFTCILPFIWDVRMVVPLVFEMGRLKLLYKIMHLLLIAYMVSNSVILDVSYMSLMGLSIAQLSILEEKLMFILEEANCRSKNYYNKGVDYHVEVVLKECVILHDMLNKFVGKLSIILSLPLFIQYSGGCLMVCNAIVQLTITDMSTTDMIGLISYSFATFSQLVLYHWLGNEIMYKSAKIVESCYLSEWYKLNRKSQKSLMLLMERAKRPLVIELYSLIYISLDTLAVIIRWAYSLVALIKANYN